MKAALLAALAEGAYGDDGRRAVESLARAVGLDTGEPVVSVAELADVARDPAQRDAVREWGERLEGLLAADPRGAGAVAAAMERHTPGSTAAWYGGDHSDFRGGVFLREVIGVQVVIQFGGAAAAPEAMAGLPPRPGGFTGRDGETSELLSALDSSASPDGSAAVLVSAVSGLGGIGKTALAVETAHLACAKGLFPGGVLFVDLHGYDEEPVTADQALQSLLRALGVPPEQIPARADDRAGLYRSVLAERGRERGAVLVLADNASSPDQVRPLLPGDERHRVLVTSRDRLTQLGARLVPLDQLAPEDARGLLDLALRIADPEDSRVTDDIDAAGRLADLCGHLPLALQIAAALLVEDPGMPVAELVDELAASHDRLAHLDDGARNVRAAFELSYRRLPPEQARLLRLLALAPGPEVSDEVAAALVGAEALPLGELRALARAHLVERGSGRGWWRLHDLVRAFGVGVVAGDEGLREEGERARERVLEFYCHWADAAGDRLRWVPGTVEPERFADRGHALAWLDAERAGLVGAVQWAREERHEVAAVQLAQCLTDYLEWRRYFDDLIVINQTAQEAAHHTGDQPGEAVAWDNLGATLGRLGRVEEAIDAHAHARDLFEAAGHREGEAAAWDGLGIVLRKAGRVQEAIDAHSRAADLHRAAGSIRREAIAWGNLGSALQKAGQTEEAIEAHTLARELFRTIGDRHHEGVAWSRIGVIRQTDGRVEEALEAHDEALGIFRELEDWHGEGETLQSLAVVLEFVDDLSGARSCWLMAADAFTRANAPDDASQCRARAGELTP
ncbi:tetratricopeptide repeat protein [Streptomyces sp. NPDC002643]